MKTLIKNIDVFNGDEVVEKSNICLENTLICYCGSNMPENWDPDHTIDGDGRLAIPGFINCHTHAAMSLTRGYADDKELMTWLQDYIWPLEGRLTEDDIYWATMLSICEMLAAGITTFADMYGPMEKAGQAVSESGIRASLAWGLIGLSDKAETVLAQATDFAVNWQGEADGRITTMLGPHAPYTCPPAFMQKVLDKAAAHNLPLHIHLAETKAEIETIDKEYKKTPVQWASDQGMFQHKTLAAHCVYLSDHDLHILKEKNVGVAYNPQSNMKLASGIAPVLRMLSEGINVGLGTDGPGSNNTLDMFREMKAGSLLQKVACGKADVMPAHTMMAMSTVNGANMLGIADVGEIRTGKRADIVIVNMDRPHLTPVFDPIAHLVYCANTADVEMVIVDGNMLYRRGEYLTIDVERVKWQIKERLQRLVE